MVCLFPNRIRHYPRPSNLGLSHGVEEVLSGNSKLHGTTCHSTSGTARKKNIVLAKFKLSMALIPRDSSGYCRGWMLAPRQAKCQTHPLPAQLQFTGVCTKGSKNTMTAARTLLCMREWCMHHPMAPRAKQPSPDSTFTCCQQMHCHTKKMYGTVWQEFCI